MRPAFKSRGGGGVRERGTDFTHAHVPVYAHRPLYDVFPRNAEEIETIIICPKVISLVNLLIILQRVADRMADILALMPLSKKS